MFALGPPLLVEADRADATQVAFFAQAVMALEGMRTRVVLGRGDDNYAMLSTGSSRSRASALIRFSHTRKDLWQDGGETSKAVDIRMPLLAILPIPSLPIDEVTVDFNVSRTRCTARR